MRRLSFALLAFVAGCRSSDIVPVTGQVTLDGRPLPNAVVVFQPVGAALNPGMGSSGSTDADGRFVLRQVQPDRPGAVRGKHIVRITLLSTAGVGGGNPGIDRLPPSYNTQSTLTCEVDAARSTPIVFALLSTGK